jgi:hypothetical protein
VVTGSVLNCACCVKSQCAWTRAWHDTGIFLFFFLSSCAVLCRKMGESRHGVGKILLHVHANRVVSYVTCRNQCCK